MSKHLPLVASAIITLFLVGCGGETETSSSGGPALSSVDAASQRDADTAERQQSQRQQQDRDSGASEQTADGSDSVANNEGSLSRNGLFPEMPQGNVAFGGALFPDFQPAEDAMASKAEMGDTYPTDISGGDNDKMAKKMEASSDDEPNDTEPVATMAAKSEPASLLPQAMKMFMEHSDQEAIDVVYANYLISDEARDQYGLNWYPGLKEPRMLFRWGVGIVFNKPRDLAGRHPVIGDPGDPEEGVDPSDRDSGGRRGRGGGLPGLGSVGSGSGGSRAGARTYKNIDTSRPDGFLMYYTGDFGEQLISFLDDRRKDDDQPYYGQILKDVMEQKMAAADEPAAAQRTRRSSGGINSSGAGFRGLAADGGGGRRGASRANNAQPLQRTDTSILDRAMGRTTAERPADDFTGSILPGVSLLGVGSKVDILDRAKSAKVDGLIVFNVKVSKSRGGNSRNRANSSPEFSSTTSMKIIDLASEKNVFSSKALKDTKVKEENDEGDDPVKDQVARAFSNYADSSFRAQDLPGGLNESAVKKRVGRLLKNKSGQPLAAAVEIISYYKSELLTAELAETAVTRLFGSDEAKVLVDGASADRLEFLKTVLPNGLGTSP